MDLGVAEGQQQMINKKTHFQGKCYNCGKYGHMAKCKSLCELIQVLSLQLQNSNVPLVSIGRARHMYALWVGHGHAA